MVRCLRERGARVDLFDESQVLGPAYRTTVAACDLVVARGRHPHLLAALAGARAQGIRVLDGADAIESVRDKRIMTAVFADAGIPVPATITGSRAEIAHAGLAYPLICKPVFGDNSAGLVIVERPADLLALDWPEDQILAQEYHPGTGADLKLYVIDDAVTAVRKASPITPCVENHLGEVVLTPELTRLARRCGELFGLNLYGVDCLETDQGIKVLEVNDFPNYTSVPFASRRLARHVLAHATAQRQVAS